MSSVIKVFRNRRNAPCASGVSRRALMGGACLFITSAAAHALAAAPSKVPHGDAGYQPSPRGSARCEKCSQFLAPASCKLVASPISPSGWCSFFVPKAA
jgi:hypothetical protein